MPGSFPLGFTVADLPYTSNGQTQNQTVTYLFGTPDLELGLIGATSDPLLVQGNVNVVASGEIEMSFSFETNT